MERGVLNRPRAMSFVLPGNARQLRFTGEAKALKDEGPGVALGKPRVRKTTTPPPAPPPPAQLVTRPSAGSSPPRSFTPASPGISERPRRMSTPVPSSYPEPQVSLRGKYTGPPPPMASERAAMRREPARDLDTSWDGEDQQSTMAFDREGADVLPGQRSTRASAAPNAAPIPHFRPASPAVQTVIVPNQSGSIEARPKGAPLALWIFAAILAGVLSYYVTPSLMTHFGA